MVTNPPSSFKCWPCMRNPSGTTGCTPTSPAESLKKQSNRARSFCPWSCTLDWQKGHETWCVNGGPSKKTKHGDEGTVSGDIKQEENIESAPVFMTRMWDQCVVRELSPLLTHMAPVEKARGVARPDSLSGSEASGFGYDQKRGLSDSRSPSNERKVHWRRLDTWRLKI